MKILPLLSAAILAASAAATAEDAVMSRVVAVVNDKVFTSLDVQNSVKSELARLRASLTGEALKTNEEKLLNMALENMINRELIYMDFIALKAQVPPALVQERIDAAISSTAGGDELLFEDNLYKEGMTMKEYRDKISQNLAVELLLANKVRNGISIPDSAVEAYYLEHRQDMSTPSRFHIAVLLIRSNGKYANALDSTLAEIKGKLAEKKETFAELAKRYSEGANAENGGDQGWMDAPNEQLKAAIINLQNGETAAEPVKIGDNYYFVNLIEVQGGGVPQLDEPLFKKLKQQLTRKEESRRYEAYIKELHMKYPVRLIR